MRTTRPPWRPICSCTSATVGRSLNVWLLLPSRLPCPNPVVEELSPEEAVLEGYQEQHEAGGHGLDRGRRLKDRCQRQEDDGRDEDRRQEGAAVEPGPPSQRPLEALIAVMG